ncbi:hypothetical protein [Brevundimonas sp.]|nr:hypothetical protein [Brevundimonas sp.]
MLDLIELDGRKLNHDRNSHDMPVSGSVQEYSSDGARHYRGMRFRY